MTCVARIPEHNITRVPSPGRALVGSHVSTGISPSNWLRLSSRPSPALAVSKEHKEALGDLTKNLNAKGYSCSSPYNFHDIGDSTFFYCDGYAYERFVRSSEVCVKRQTIEQHEKFEHSLRVIAQYEKNRASPAAVSPDCGDWICEALPGGKTRRVFR